MLIFDRTHRVWAALSLVVSVVAAGVYVWYANSSLNGPSGGSLPGLIFGIIAAGMMVFAGLLAARRRFPAARVGSAQFWMRGHLWIGTLTVPFALFHAGFGWGGRLEILLWILFIAVVLSGFWGLALQQILPRMMLEQLPRETFVEQIPHLCTRFTAESDRMLAEVCGPLDVTLTAVELKQFESHLRPHFEKDRSKRRNDYPKTISDAAHFQIFLSKLYAGVSSPVPAAVTAPLVADATKYVVTDADAIRNVTPNMKSVAQITVPQADPPTPPVVPVDLSPVEAAPVVAQGKPDAKAMLAAMKAKKAATAEAAPHDAKSEPATPHIAAADTPSPPAATVPAVPAGKPDAKAMLAAMKAKKAASAEAPPIEAKPELATSPIAAAAPPSPPAATVPVVAVGKPDAKAMLAAMKAKRDAAAEATTPVSGAAGALERTPAAESSPAPVIQQKPVKAPAALTPAGSDPLTTGRVAPPSKSQVAELKQFYLELIRPQLPMQPDSHRWMEAIRRSTMACGIRQDNQHPEFIGIFDQLRDLCEQRRQFAFVQRYHRWLHGWLLVHIPATVALYFILAVHAVMALRVIPFGN